MPSFAGRRLRGRDLNPDFAVQSRANCRLFDPAGRWSRIAPTPTIEATQARRSRPRRKTREEVAELLAQGLRIGEIARRLDVTPATVSYHARRLGMPASRKYAPRGDWAEIQRFYDAGHSVRECQKRFGFSRRSWNKAVIRGDVVPRPQAMPIDELLVAGPERSRTHIKLRLLSAGIKENHCEECGISEWLGEPLSMTLHHVNGDGHDNRVENLLLLCPNCHSQTPNFGRRSPRAAA
jgi:DNA-binding transcriptional ArsR family regulator